MVLIVMLYKVVVAFEYVEEVLKSDHLNESHYFFKKVIPRSTVYHATQGGLTF